MESGDDGAEVSGVTTISGLLPGDPKRAFPTMGVSSITLVSAEFCRLRFLRILFLGDEASFDDGGGACGPLIGGVVPAMMSCELDRREWAGEEATEFEADDAGLAPEFVRTTASGA